MSKTTLTPTARRMAGTGHLPPEVRAKLREERAARREQAAMLASNEALAAAKRRKSDGANRQTDPVDPGFSRPSNADDLPAPRPSKAK